MTPTPTQPPAAVPTVEFDGVLNDLGWKMNDWLTSNGAKFDGRVFNNMKSFLRDCIQEWLDRQAPQAEQPGAAVVPEALRSAIADLRHLYANLKNGLEGATRQADIADNLLSPAIRKLERVDAALAAAPAPTTEQAAPAKRPPPEWYVRMATETEGLDDNLPCGALAAPRWGSASTQRRGLHPHLQAGQRRRRRQSPAAHLAAHLPCHACGRPEPERRSMNQQDKERLRELVPWLRENGSGIYRPAAEAADLILALLEENERLAKALQKIIGMNVQYAIDKYGDASKAENMGCVRVARAAMAKQGEK